MLEDVHSSITAVRQPSCTNLSLFSSGMASCAITAIACSLNSFSPVRRAGMSSGSTSGWPISTWLADWTASAASARAASTRTAGCDEL